MEASHLLRRSLAFASLALLSANLTVDLTAQRRDEYARAPGVRPDHTIFSPLDLPAPNRMRTGSGAPGPDYWQQQVDYVIDVALETETRTIRGRERVTYHNNSPEIRNKNLRYICR